MDHPRRHHGRIVTAVAVTLALFGSSVVAAGPAEAPPAGPVWPP